MASNPGGAMIRLLIVPLMVIVAAGGEALAQDAFPAPLPGVNGSPPSASPPVSAFPSYGVPPIGTLGAGPAVAPGISRECGDGYASLRQDAERKGKLITSARERRASPDEACKLISAYQTAEIKLIKYVEANAAKCAIPAQIAQQLNATRGKTAELQSKVCTLAQEQMRKHAPAGPSGDFWPTTNDAPI